MQFLQISEVTRRRIFIEELLLMLLRMGLLAVLVFALAGPFLTVANVARLGPPANRDVVLVFDGSYSMGSTRGRPRLPSGAGDAGPARQAGPTSNSTPFEAAKEWALAFVDDLAPGDTVAILQAKDVVIPVLAEPSHDLSQVR